MRKMIMSCLVLGLAAMPLAACEVEDEADGDTTGTDVQGSDIQNTTKTYNAAQVNDKWTKGANCSSPNTKAEGFDLDAVSLWDSNSKLVGHADKVFGTSGISGDTGCGYDNGAPNIDDAKDAPDGNKDTGYVALNGGSVAVEFAPNSPVIQAGDVIEVHETQCSVCKDEPYELMIVSNGGCVNGSCANSFKVGDGNGKASFPVPSSAF